MPIESDLININDINIQIYVLKLFFISMCTYFLLIKITNTTKKKNTFLVSMLIFIIVSISSIIKYETNSFIGIACLIILLSLIASKHINNGIGFTMLGIIISLSINYIIFFIAIIISFIPNIILKINNDYTSLLVLVIIHSLILYMLFKVEKIKYGFSFLRYNSKNEFIEIVILNISIIIIFSFIIFTNMNIELSRNIFFGFIIFSILMFITIQKSLQLYYKQELLKRNIEEKEKEVKNKNKELQEKDKKLEELEKENLKLNKKIHSINHRQDSLEYKLDTLTQKSEISEEIDIRDRINKISKTIEEDEIAIELTKTNIEIIDDMLKYMQAKCTKDNIDFDLKINGNIKNMTKNIVSKEDLEILISDLIKNAIIAINYSNNINKSILVRLGIIDGIYSLYVYDTGIEFKIETLLNLGIKPSTTHADNGGTGMGFMNTFDTLNKYKASIIIKEYGKESKDNYTKAIIIKFDKNNNYKINSYRSDKIKEKEPKNIIIEKL